MSGVCPGPPRALTRRDPGLVECSAITILKFLVTSHQEPSTFTLSWAPANDVVSAGAYAQLWTVTARILLQVNRLTDQPLVSGEDALNCFVPLPPILLPSSKSQPNLVDSVSGTLLQDLQGKLPGLAPGPEGDLPCSGRSGPSRADRTEGGKETC